MTSRRRRFVAVTLQLSFALALAEGAWASMCPPEALMDMGSAATELGPTAQQPMTGMMGMDAPTGGSDDQSSSTPSDCPLALLGATGTCASLAAVAALRLEDLLSPADRGLPAFLVTQTHGDLMGSGLFRPPKQ
jgi:hypothetical protein